MKLHITNGDATAEILAKFLPEADTVLPWRDVLYVGPVRGYDAERTEFLCQSHPELAGRITADFVERADLLGRAREFEEVVLWFEHDLYDQLQLIEILTRLHHHHVYLICINCHNDVENFRGLGQLNEQQLAALLPTAKKVSEAEMATAQFLWQAFTHETPEHISKAAAMSYSDFAFMQNALKRWMLEFPDRAKGLSFTEEYILKSLSDEFTNLKKAFNTLPEHEGKFFMGLGDTIFLQKLAALGQENALVETKDGWSARITPLGREVLAGRFNPQWQHRQEWRGGTLLHANNLWVRSGFELQKISL